MKKVKNLIFITILAFIIINNAYSNTADRKGYYLEYVPKITTQCGFYEYQSSGRRPLETVNIFQENTTQAIGDFYVLSNQEASFELIFRYKGLLERQGEGVQNTISYGLQYQENKQNAEIVPIVNAEAFQLRVTESEIERYSCFVPVMTFTFEMGEGMKLSGQYADTITIEVVQLD